MICSGLNPTIKSDGSFDPIPVLIGAIAGGVGLLVLAIAFGAYHRSQTRKNQMLTPEELAKMAESQVAMGSPLTQSSYPIGSGSYPQMTSARLDSPGDTSNPLYKGPASVSSFSSGGQNLTPYQQQYLAQQQAIADGKIDPGQSRVAPSVRASAMVKRAISAPPSINASATPLVVVFEFVAEREDELNAAVGDKMLGIEQQDGWWLAQNAKGVMGLIPVSYTQPDTGGPGPSTTGRVDPQF